jgi:ATP/maltotriose-dependent transcriptional regulator MalT
MGLAEPLTKREVEILRRLASGLPITQIANTLHISHNTIKTHLKSVYRKLNVESRAQALERAKDLLLV